MVYPLGFEWDLLVFLSSAHTLISSVSFLVPVKLLPVDCERKNDEVSVSFSVVPPAQHVPSFQEPVCDVDTGLGAGPGSAGGARDVGPLPRSIPGVAAGGEGPVLPAVEEGPAVPKRQEAVMSVPPSLL